MNELPMPSDLRKPEPISPAGQQPIEPPSAKLIIKLFLIPLLIAAAVIGIMIPIGRMAGTSASMETALERLKRPGGQRTLGLVGPGAKQRYMDAKTVVDHMKQGLSEPERIKLAADLREILENHTHADEGEVQHFVLLALGRVWQKDPAQPDMNSPEAVASRRQTLELLVRYFDARTVPARKAAILALAFWQGQAEARQAIPALLDKLENQQEDLDVRIAAVATLGNIASPEDDRVIEALNLAMRDTDPRNVELVWNAASALAQFNRPEAADTIMMLLDRQELAGVKVYDRETDPQNPVFRRLTDEEQQRILINTMERARHLDVPRVQEQLRRIVESDPSVRVRLGGMEVLKSGG